MMQLCVILLAIPYVVGAQTIENEFSTPAMHPVNLPVDNLTMAEQRMKIMNQIIPVTKVILKEMAELFEAVKKTKEGRKTLNHIYTEINDILVDEGFSQLLRFVSKEIKKIVKDPEVSQLFASLLRTSYKVFLLDDITDLHYLLTDIHDIIKERHNLKEACHIVDTGCSDIMKDKSKQELINIFFNSLSEQYRTKHYSADNINPSEDSINLSEETDLETDPSEIPEIPAANV